MNILIVGNGFDLSHYLPTKYDHFMVAMDAIENWDESQGDMRFDDLFGKDYWHKNDKTGEEWQNSFFQHTKAMYKTDEIKISVDQVKELKAQLKENVWYQYFSDHVREVKTWIDFENKIEDALDSVSELFQQISDYYLGHDVLSCEVSPINFKKQKFFGEVISLSERVCQLLCLLNLIHKKKDNIKKGDYSFDDDNSNFFTYFIVNENVKKFTNYDVYDQNKALERLNDELASFIEIFNKYIILIDIMELDVKFCKLPILIDKVYSFNYTNTFGRFYDLTDSQFLHGKSGLTQNIVLGISDLKNEYLKKLKAYGFTKYHQKIFKNTNYKFLYENLAKINEIIENIEFWSNSTIADTWKNSEQISSDQHTIHLLRNELKEIKGCIYIWGHSLDISDENYIKEIFSVNFEKHKNFEIVIYSFSQQAYFDHLCNLLHILGKEKVELWMKKGWLKFEKNPDIAEINGIKPVDLPKIIAKAS
ncbi:hypothetical protein BEN74_09060 [Acinetobacter sp. WCHAc010034]|uniref:AbiH family protein n=1 Tax=Acinetobacter sp. WCHAc010034 TaxID=1879049 RepID=UPI00083B4F42|nr:AbiH family protein [Acinetobacter sp. WCHAc010034]AYA02979.1 hypothetical protein BEN74_09060 [Acinetobacter sp. WCHAc010034]